MIPDEATRRQIAAADEAASTWVTANAGSGKTRVLTDRVARLLLGGTPPQRILCLTYTKAAAAEMQNRLFRRLGDWAMRTDAALSDDLAGLGLPGPFDPDRLAAARRLFARAIETPGGLRIQTIHGFCASLLRRFPLEAGVPPRFAEMDDRSAEILRGAVLDALAAEDRTGAMATVVQHYRGESLAALAKSVADNRAAFDPPREAGAIRAAFGLDPALTAEALCAAILGQDGVATIRAILPALAAGSPNDAKAAAALAALPEAPALPDLAILEKVFLFGDGAKAPFAAKIGAFPTKATREALGPRLDALEALMARVEAGRPRRIALIAAERTAALHRFAAAFLPAYAEAKAARGWLDFDDLILRARALLTDPSVSPWVLWRLDGGIDHVLVDEAQDTSPAQWDVIERLTQEFLAGDGAREGRRTLFVVGDRKQSIYSFQGADLTVFDAMQARFAERLEPLGGLRRAELAHSFRSAPAILRAVDCTFDDAAGRGIGGAMRHIAFHGAMPGRVDLWPIVPKPEAPEPAPWDDPRDLPRPEDPDVVLAEAIATAIAGWIAEGTRIPHRGGARPLRPGDILILVQRRSRLFAEVIRACKARGLPMAGADRLKLGAELAVKDLAALLSFVDLPEDDLSLATALRSPLFGWSEGDLHALAFGRAGSLWQALRAAPERWAETLAVLTDLRDAADYLRPFELIDRVLTRHGGRARLVARLGPEAEDGIDQLLAQALTYERTQTPSLTGFLAWLSTDDVEARRQVDAASNRIRVMTVHGAKGLEAPVVILPDAADRRPPGVDAILRLADGMPAWRGAAGESPPAIEAAVEAAKAARAAEADRLLYVAMTRAESWLIVAAAGSGEGEDAWHARVRAGLVAAGAVPQSFPTGEGLRLASGDWPAPVGAPAAEGAPPPAPAVPRGPLPPAAAMPLARSPSDLGGAKALPGEDEALPAEAARARGTALHSLLETLPALDAAEWRRVAAAVAGGRFDPDILLAEAAGILGDAALAPLFAAGTLAEATVTATLDGVRWIGTVDRLIVAADRVLAVDYKSNRVVPDRPEAVPEGILRQMGAYAAMLGAIYPGQRIETAILWTQAPLLMPLPAPLISAAFRRAVAP